MQRQDPLHSTSLLPFPAIGSLCCCGDQGPLAPPSQAFFFLGLGQAKMVYAEWHPLRRTFVWPLAKVPSAGDRERDREKCRLMTKKTDILGLRSRRLFPKQEGGFLFFGRARGNYYGGPAPKSLPKIWVACTRNTDRTGDVCDISHFCWVWTEPPWPFHQQGALDGLARGGRWHVECGRHMDREALTGEWTLFLDPPLRGPS